MSLNTTKAVEVLLENAIETHEHETSLLDMTTRFTPDSAVMQQSANNIWRQVDQQAPIIEGWDTSGTDTGIIQQSYLATLTEPKNDKFSLRADDMREMSFWENRGKESGRKQASNLNHTIAHVIGTTGTMFIRSNTASGYNFIGEAQAMMNERQLAKGTGRCFLLNDRDTFKFTQDLAGRQTLQGAPDATWRTGQIAKNVAEFDVYTGSYLGVLGGGASPNTKVTSKLSFKPEGQDTINGTLQNVDYRVAKIPVTSTAGYKVGDKIELGTNALSLTDKDDTGQKMVFSIVSIGSETELDVYPKPIALDDSSLSIEQKAYANVKTQIAANATVKRLNIDATAKSNLFWEKDSIEVIGGDAPLSLMNQFGGMKVVQSVMSNGQTMYALYDGDINTAKFTCRLFTWYGVNNRNPSNNGVAVTYT